MSELVSSHSATVLYVGHKFHVKTRSTRFLLDILEESFSVDLFLIDDETDLEEIIIPKREYKFVLIFQVDSLAPAFLAAGHRVVVAPMYDGSGSLPDIHWKILSKCLFLNFSFHMHLKISRLGGKSLLLKYFPEPVSNYIEREFDTRRAFFWRRRPDHNIDLPLIEKLFGTQLDSLHIHDAPDIKTGAWIAARRRQWSHLAKKVTISSWFEDSADLQRTVDRANIYFAPRIAEGIGMGFLEAMARGMAVIAHNKPTHNEYIVNWSNGILFDFGIDSIDLSRDKLISLARNARKSVQIGHEEWLMQRELIKPFCESAVASYSCDEDTVNSILRLTWGAYKAGVASYERALSSSPLIRKIYLEQRPRRSLPHSDIPRHQRKDNFPVLDAEFIDFSRGRARMFLKSGWSHDEDNFVWMCSTRALIEFSKEGELTGLRVDSWRPDLDRGVPPIAVIVNGAFAGTLPEDGIIGLERLPPDVKKGGSYSLEFVSEYSARIGSDPRQLVMAVMCVTPVFD